MKIHATPLVQGLLAALAATTVATAAAVPLRSAALDEAPSVAPGAAPELVLMVCQPGAQMPAAGSEPPLLCLATEADEDALQMGAEDFRQLLEKAAASGRVHILVIQRE